MGRKNARKKMMPEGPPTPPRPAAAQLPAEVWQRVADYLHTPALSHVCQSTRAALERRHLVCRTTTRSARRKLARLRDDPQVRTLHLKVHAGHAALKNLASPYVYPHPATFPKSTLEVLPTLPALSSLTLEMPNLRLADEGVEAFSVLPTLPVLRTLRLDLSCNQLGNYAACVLAELRQCPVLETLAVNLSSNFIGDGGAEALALLRETPALQSLTVILWGNQLSAHGYAALKTLRTVRRVDLTMDFAPSHSH
eukprot:EG_transcript_23490